MSRFSTIYALATNRKGSIHYLSGNLVLYFNICFAISQFKFDARRMFLLHRVKAPLLFIVQGHGVVCIFSLAHLVVGIIYFGGTCI